MAAAGGFFSPSYAEARRRFLEASAAAPYHRSLQLTDDTGKPLSGMAGEDLTIDIAGYGNVETPSRIFLHTSGIHGVEGYAGSAIQLAVIAEEVPKLMLSPQECVLFIHAWNPYGMSWLRRWNENNVDLNRNFFPFVKGSEDPWAARGTSESYHLMHPIMNPTSLGMFDTVTFYGNMAYVLARLGFPAMKQAMVEGQFAYPQGLFFGGSRLEQSNILVRDWLLDFLKDTPTLARWVNINVHTGLGPYGVDSMLVDGSKLTDKMQRAFGDHLCAKKDEGPDTGVGYHLLGSGDKGLREVLASKFPDVEVHACTQEFGTYSAMTVLQALRAENVAWHTSKATAGVPLPAGHAAKKGVLDVFYIADPKWEAAVLSRGLEVFRQATGLAFE